MRINQSDSETSTLLAPSVDKVSNNARCDRPLYTDQFLQHAKTAKLILAVLLIASCVSAGTLIQASLDDGSHEPIGRWRIWCYAISLALKASTGSLLFRNLLTSQTPLPTHTRAHSRFCQTAFFLLLLAVLVQALPWARFVFTHHRSPPSQGHLGVANHIFSVSAWLIASCTRRGPLLRYDPPMLGTGFGIRGDLFGLQEDGGMPNVLDWEGCSMLSWITLSYNAGIALKALRSENLQPQDIPFLEQRVRMDHADPDALLEQSCKEGQAQGGLLLWAVYKPMTWIIFSCFSIEFVSLLAGYMQIAALHELIGTFSGDNEDHSYAYLACAGLFVGQILQTALSAFVSSKESYQLCEPMRLVLSSLLYQKVMRARDMSVDPDGTNRETSQGKARAHILNIVTPDVFAVAVAGKEIWILVNQMLSIGMALGFLYYLIGKSALIGVAATTLTVPASYWVSAATYHCQQKLNSTTDARVTVVKEFFDSIKVIKLNGWQDHFVRRISIARDIELVWQRWRFHLATFFTILTDQVPLLSLVAVFAFHTLVLGNTLDPATAFVVTNVYNRLRMAVAEVPLHLGDLLKARLSLIRIVDFLNEDDIVKVPTCDEEGIQVVDATIAWSKLTDGFRLHDVHLDIRPGLTIVCGALGQGKTLLLQAILGEVAIQKGSIRVSRSDVPVDWSESTWITASMAYAPQVPYIRHGSIRDNILFGQPMWDARYWQVVRQTGLQPDLCSMEEGDMTESGGQKARINLARCIYSRAKTVLLDDVLSAVDAHTAQHIFDECLQGELIQGRTVVLVTHLGRLCSAAANSIITIQDGRVSQRRNKPDPVHRPLKASKLPDLRLNTAATRPLYSKEQRQSGGVATSHYAMVINSAGGKLYWASLLLILLATSGFKDSRQYILRLWTNDTAEHETTYYLGVYLAVTLVTSCFGALRWFVLYGIGNVGMYNRGVRVIHHSLVSRLARAPLRFFDTTPKGRLLNVLTMDVLRLDSWSADTLFRSVNESLQAIVSASLMCFFQPELGYVLLALIPPFVWVCGFLRRLRADMRRMFSISTSPLASLWTDTIDGVVMVRAFGLQDVYTQTMVMLKNQDMKIGSLGWFAYLWARVIINMFAAILLSATGVVLVNGSWSAPQAGLIMTFAMLVSGSLYEILEQASRLDETFVSAERINQYVQLQDQESTIGLSAPPAWPAEGRVTIRDLQVRYAKDLPAVLHDINLDISAGERVGLVGATGSGKSTLALSIFRGNLQTAGRIDIDGINIGALKLKDLRCRLNMVVQETTLCSGTLRDALDIGGEKDDHELYEVLRQVHLLDDDPGNAFSDLNTLVASGGSNFSQGQRQLLCLARALLKRSKVLVMDEATSSVDYETDAKITSTINECFKGVTMLVIAHRLSTVMHYDRVVVLDAGRIIEQGRPADLLSNAESHFSAMCRAQGEEEYQRLRTICVG